MATTWVALLRGVNVGGVTIRSADLTALFAEEGFRAVRTVLASGNVVFEADGDVEAGPALVDGIERALAERFAYDAALLLVTREELRAAVDAFPFDADDTSRQPWVVFCSDTATRDELIASAGDDRDPVAAGPGVVYWNPPKGSTTDTPFAKVLAKSVYRRRTTNRNLRTLLKILV